MLVREFLDWFRFINFRGWNILNKTRLTITIYLLRCTKLNFLSDICVHLLWKLVSQNWHKIVLCFFPEHFPFTKPTFCTAVLDKQMKLSNKCRPVAEEYQINSSHQTVVQFESKFISIRKAKLCYVTTLPFARRALF